MSSDSQISCPQISCDSDIHVFKDQPLKLVSRRSPLAMRQAEIVATKLKPIPVHILGVSTKGDEILDRPLTHLGGKGAFVKRLETELLEGRAEAAIHSLKDMETQLAEGTKIAAILAREDRRDALVGPYADLDDLPPYAHIGSASVRRTALLKHKRPDIRISLLRGNVGTRLKRLEDGEFDAIILAMAGLKRLGLQQNMHPLSEESMPPAAGQGALAIQSLSHESGERAAALARLWASLHCVETALCVTAERAVLAGLDGSCQTPIAVRADRQGGLLTLKATILSLDGRQKFEADIKGEIIPEPGEAPNMAYNLGAELAVKLLDLCGGREFLSGSSA